MMPLESAMERPHYGYLSDPKDWNIHERYGAVVLEVNPNVVRRTSFTIGNSSGIEKADADLGSVFTHDNPHALFRRKLEYTDDGEKYFKSILEGGNFKDFSMYYSYIEAQYHGGLSMRDVTKISFPRSGYSHIKELAEKYNIPYTTY